MSKQIWFKIEEECDECRGTGNVEVHLGGDRVEAECPDCDGTGRLEDLITLEQARMLILEQE